MRKSCQQGPRMTHPITIFCSGNYRTSATRCVWLSQQHTQFLSNDFCFEHDPFNSMSAIHPRIYINARVGYSSEDKKAEASEFLGRGNP